MTPLIELEEAYRSLKKDPCFKRELKGLLESFTGRPTPLYLSEKLTSYCGARVYLKREDLCHTGAHKINNALGQGLAARYTSKKRVVAETGAGQHGVACATAAALLDLECTVYMGYRDIERQSENVSRMRMLGARVEKVDTGEGTLKDAVNAAIQDWVSDPLRTYYLLGSCVGPHPYPLMVRDFQSVIGREVKKQLKGLPTHLAACVGGGSNSIGLFYPFFRESGVSMTGIEAAGAASLTRGKVGVLHGSMSYLLYGEDGQIELTSSAAPGLDYSGVGPEHSFYRDTGRAEYVRVDDKAAVDAFMWMMRNEGIIPALESSHALAWVMGRKWKKDDTVVVCLSGRGEKDLDIVRGFLEKEGNQ